MAAEAWIALVAVFLPIITGVVYGCVLFALLRRDMRDMKENHLPHIRRVLEQLPCRQRGRSEAAACKLKKGD